MLGLAALLLGVFLFYHGLVEAPFTLTLFCAIAFLLLIKERLFTTHLENCTLLITLTAPVGWLFWQGRLPRDTDLTQFHLYWINELDRLIRKGNFYPRWAPDFTWQQGWPVFNFYPPGSRYFPEILHLAGLSFNNGLMLAAYLSLILGVVGCYFWCYEVLENPAGAVLGGFVFCYLPYRLLDFFAIGQLSNYMGGAILPWIVWLLTRLVRRNRGAIWLGLAGRCWPLPVPPNC